MRLLTFLEATKCPCENKEGDCHCDEKDDKKETVGSNDGEVNSDDEKPRPEPQARGQEGSVSWDWTDPYHSSGAENAVMSRTP